MINNYMCEQCDKAAVCKIMDILAKFSDDAKKPLGVDISMDSCLNFVPDEESVEETPADE